MSSNAQRLEREDSLSDSFLAHLPVIFWQRRWFVIVPAVLLAIAGIAAAFLLPTSYQSRAVLLVESQELPKEIVGTPVTDVIDQRIARMRQQILSRPDLIELIQTNDLYADKRQREPLSRVIEDMRGATSIDAINADIQQGQNGSNTIAFSLAFNYPEAAKAQLVAQSFVERFLELDSAQSEEQTANTVSFLDEQAQQVGTQLRDVESQIERIKAENGLALTSGGFTGLASSGGGYEAQIAQLQRENSVLAAQLSQQATADTRDPVVVGAETALAAARAVYSDNHPDVRLAEQRLAEARALARTNSSKQAAPAGAALRAAISGNNAVIAQLQAARAADSARTGAAISAQAQAPLVLERVNQLQARADGLRTNYERISQQLMSAQAAAQMSSEQRGERLSVIDPPVVPDRPSSPNRLMLIAGGIFGGIGLGLALALAVELLLQPIRGVASLNRLLGVPPMVVVPTMRAGDSWRTRILNRLKSLAFWRRRRVARPA